MVATRIVIGRTVRGVEPRRPWRRPASSQAGSEDDLTLRQRRIVDSEAVLHIALQYAFAGLIDIVHRNHFDVGEMFFSALRRLHTVFPHSSVPTIEFKIKGRDPQGGVASMKRALANRSGYPESTHNVPIRSQDISMIREKITAFVATVLLVAGTTGSRASEAVPAALQPPAGYTVAFTAKATGVQIYTSTADGGTMPKWVLEAPLAELKGSTGVIHHYAGPSWEAADGSKVTRDMGTPVTTVPAQRASADIPWLLVKVTADPAAGVLNKVAYVQRVSTQGGVAPANPPTRVGTKVGVPYTATYVFYTQSN